MEENPWIELFVPGRICLFGEHSDWAGGFRRFNEKLEPGMTIVCGTNQGIYARVRRAPKLVLASVDHRGARVGARVVEMDARALLAEAKAGGFWSYAAGTAYKISTDARVGGVEVDNYRTTLPMGKGLSSSAAMCVLVARAFSRLYEIKMTLRGEMECVLARDARGARENAPRGRHDAEARSRAPPHPQGTRTRARSSRRAAAAAWTRAARSAAARSS